MFVKDSAKIESDYCDVNGVKVGMLKRVGAECVVFDTIFLFSPN